MESLAKCPLCKQSYNLDDHQPQILIPCGHTICEKCVYKDVTPQDQSKITCSIDHDPVNLVESVISNAHIVSQLKQNFGIKVHCPNHHDQPAEFIHYFYQKLICSHCVTSSQYKAQIESYNYAKLQREVETLDKYFDIQEKKIQEAFQKLLKQKEETRSLLDFNTSKDGASVYSMLKKSYQYFKDNNISITSSDSHDKLSYQLKIGFDASIILKNSPQEKILLNEWIEFKYHRATLLYCASVHGFSAKSFHQRCDFKAPTLTLINTKQGYVFGGFTAASWASASPGTYVFDPKAFIFSLSFQTKHELDFSKRGYAICNQDDNLMAFGKEPHDIFIANNADTHPCSFSEFGTSYEVGKDSKPVNYLTGSQNYLVQEIEVFQLHQE